MSNKLFAQPTIVREFAASNDNGTTYGTNIAICINNPFTLKFTPRVTLRYYICKSTDGGTTWIRMTTDPSITNAGVPAYSNPAFGVPTKLRILYTTDYLNDALPVSSYVYSDEIINLTVNPNPVVSSVSLGQATICQNSTTTATNTTPNGVWSSDDLTVATVNQSGIVTGIHQGFAQISYTVTDNNNCVTTKSDFVTVNPTPIISSYSDAVCSGIQYAKIPSGLNTSGARFNWGMPTTTATNPGDLTGMAPGTSQTNVNALLVNNTISVIAANYSITATLGACTSAPFILTLSVTPKPYIANRVDPACSGASFVVTPTNGGGNIVPVGITYSWSTPSLPTGLTGGAASGAGSPTSISGLLTNSTNGALSATYVVSTYNDGCAGSTFTETINVNPTPNIVASQYATICSNSTFSIPLTNGANLVPAGTTYSWNAPGDFGINGFQAGVNASLISGTLSNTTNATISNIRYLVTPTAGACSGVSFNVYVTVNPVPIIPDIGSTQTGSGSTFNFPINGSIVPIGTTYYWASPSVQTGITGGAASGVPSPTSLTGTLTNPTGAALNAVYTITPTYLNCVGNNFTFTVTVYPKPIIGSKTLTAICSGQSFVVSLTDNVGGDVIPSGTTYSWPAPIVAGITGTATGTAVGTISGTLNNLTNYPIVVSYSVIPYANPQAGDPFTVSITVNPLPISSIVVTENSGLQTNDNIICSSSIATFTSVPVVGQLTDYEYTWTVPVSATAPGSAPSFTSSVAGTYSLSIKNINTGCISAVQTSTVLTVNTIPNVGTISSTSNAVCIGSSLQLNTVGDNGGATPYTYNWTYPTIASGNATTNTSTVTIGGASPGNGDITYNILDHVGCYSNSSTPFNVTVYAIPLLPTVTPVNVVYDGISHQVIATPAAAPVGSDVVEWYAASSGGVAINPTPAHTNVINTSYWAQAINSTTGCVNNNRVNETIIISRKGLVVTANDYQKIYDRNVYSGGNGITFTDPITGVGPGFVNGETVAALGGSLTYGGSSQNTINAGTYSIVPGGLTSANYNITFVAGTLTVAKKVITITGFSVQDKVYDATDNATVISGSLSGVISGDGINVTLNPIAKFSSKNVGANLMITSVSTLSGSAAPNYTLDQTINATATITAKHLNVVGLVTTDKIYDGTIAAPIAGGAFLAAITPGSGTSNDKKPFINDNIVLAPAGYFATKDVGNNITITSTTSITGTDMDNYILDQPVLTSRNITRKSLQMIGLSVTAPKVYDGTTSSLVAGTPALLVNEAPGTGTVNDGKTYTNDVVSIIGTPIGTYNSKNVSTDNSVSFSGLSLTGTNAGNYSLVIQAAVASTILPKNLTMSGLSVPASKVYDGTTTSVVNGIAQLQAAENPNTGTTDDGKPYTGDVVSIAGTPIGTYNNKTVPLASSVAFSALSLTGSDASNYSFTIQSNATSSITPKHINAINIVTSDKIYDGTTAASVTGGSFIAAINAGTGTSADKTPYINDNIVLVPSGYFVSKDVANNIAITSTSTISGSDKDNYILDQPTLIARNITPKILRMNGLSVSAPKTYDGTNSSLVAGTPTLLLSEAPGAGNVNDGKSYTNDVVSIVGTPIGTFNTKDVVTANSVSFSGLSLAGVNAGNYSLLIQAAVASTILPKNLTMFGLTVPASKEYDGNTNSIVNGTAQLQAAENPNTGNTSDGRPYTGDNVSIVGTAVGTYNSFAVTLASYVSFSGLSLTGTEASNYTFTIQGNAPSIITTKNIKVVADPQTKIYGNADPVFTYVNDPLVAGDSFTGLLTRDPGENAGVYQINLGTLSLGSNYTITYVPNNLTITRASIIIIPDVINRTYGDVPLPASFATSNFKAIGLQNGEVINTITLYTPSGPGSGNDLKDGVGNYIGVVKSGLPNTGTINLENYRIEFYNADIIIGKLPITITADPKEKRMSQSDPLFTYQISRPLVEGDVVTGGLTRMPGETVGFYPILQGDLAINDNYDISYLSANLEILTIERVMVIPNAFTPNNDGLNDVLKVMHNSTIVSINYFRVFNRAGNLIYETKNMNEGWDGKINGSIADADAYYWIVEYNTWDHKIFKVKGSTLLIK
jgi:gliding motility-associated-like protein